MKKKSKLKKKIDDANKKRVFLKKTFLYIILISFILFLFYSINRARILRVEIVGLKYLNPIDIISDSSLSDFNNISLFRIPKKEIISRIEENLRLKVNSIKISFPDVLVINVTERDTLYLLESKYGIYEITDEGYMIKESVIRNYNVPYITGLMINPTNKIVENDYTKYLTTVLSNLKYHNVDIYNIVSEINAYGNDLILYTRGYPVQVILEKYVKAEKFVELAGVLRTVNQQATRTYRIDFRFNEAITVN